VKTISLKKVSAVAVASLGFGLLSVVPVNAAGEDSAATLVSSISLALDTTSPTAGSIVNVAFGAIVTADAADDDDVARFKAYINAAPAGGFVTATFEDDYAGITDTELGTSDEVTAGSLVVTEILNAGDATASTTAGNAGINFTPTKAGTYTLIAYHDADNDGNLDNNEARQSVDIVVAAPAGYSAALSTVFIATDLTDDNTGLATAVTNATDAPLAIRTIGQKAAQIIVTTRDSDNAIYTGQAITATMSGSGFVSAGSTADGDANGVPTATEANAGDGSATTTRSAAVTSAANTTGIVTIGVWGDGTAGTGTVTITVTDKVSGATTTLATKTVTWYSSVAATLTVTTLQSIATPGAANGCSDATTCTQATLALTPAYVIVAKDSGGRVVPGLTITGTPADTSIIASTSVAIVTGGDDKNGRGYYNASVTGGAAANVGKKTVITWSTTLADGVTKITTTSEATLGGTPATVTWSTDKTTYTPGAPVVITVTAKDAGGNTAADGTYATLFAGASTLGGSITGSTPAASVEILGGKATYTAFAPGTGGTYAVSNKFGASMPSALQGTAISTSIVVSDPNAALLTQIDALNAKIVALNALIAKIMKKLGVK
jgi:hypothetical protein